jgi:hypothetical protein
MGRFVRIWCELLAHRLRWVKGVSDVYKLLPPALLAGLSALAAIWGTVPWWVIPLTALAVFYFSLTAGMAWEISKKPSFIVSDLQIDRGVVTLMDGPRQWSSDVFYVTVTVHDAPAIPEVKIIKVVGGRRSLEAPVMAHWRNKDWGYCDGMLSDGEEQQFGLLRTSRTVHDNPSLETWDMNDKCLPLTSDLPLGQQQQALTIVAVVRCDYLNGDRRERGEKQTLTFQLAPDTSANSAPGGYKIVTNKPVIATKPRRRSAWIRFFFLLKRMVQMRTVHRR